MILDFYKKYILYPDTLIESSLLNNNKYKINELKIFKIKYLSTDIFFNYKYNIIYNYPFYKYYINNNFQICGISFQRKIIFINKNIYTIIFINSEGKKITKTNYDISKTYYYSLDNILQNIFQIFSDYDNQYNNYFFDINLSYEKNNIIYINNKYYITKIYSVSGFKLILL